MTLTDKQKDIIRTLSLGHERDELLDLDELLELLPYTTTKQSIQFSIRILIKKGLVEKHGIRQRATDAPASSFGVDGYRPSESEVDADLTSNTPICFKRILKESY